MRIILLYVFFLTSLLTAVDCTAMESPVLLFLSRQDQADTLGYNIVNELPVIVYKEIMAGRVALWDSPNKEIQIQPSSLKRLETSSGDEFIHARQLFIYELWDLDKKKGALKTVGFYFSSRTTQGEEVSYGFVEYAPLESLFSATSIPSNSNGNCDLTFYEALKNKYYFYNVVQVGDKKIKSIKEALSLKEEVKLFVNQRTVAQNHDCKDVFYRIEPGNSSDAEAKSFQFLQSVQKFFNENREVFYNLGGNRIRNFVQPQQVIITGVEVHERWRKAGDNIESELLSIQVYAENQALDVLPADQLHLFDLLVDFKSVSDFLNEKEFYFRITKINNQEILESQSAAFLKGLNSWKWNQLTEFVRYE